MSPADALRAELLDVVPDHPAWIEARAALLDPAGRLFGDPSGYVVRSDRWRIAGIGGAAPEELIRGAFADIETVAPGSRPTAVEEWAVVQPEGFSSAASAALSSWVKTEADIFHEPVEGLRPFERAPGVKVELARPGESAWLAELPEDLRAELGAALGRDELAAAWTDGRPVSFCYVACRSSTLWDVSINTLEEYRRRGLADAVVTWLAERMRARGLRAVWGAHRHNRPSRRLARKLGFEPAGRLFLFENTGESQLSSN